MSRFDEPCRLAALALLALIMASEQALFAQAPNSPPAQNLVQPPAKLPVEPTPPAATPPASTPSVPAAVPARPPTPEELGDSKVENPTAAVWNKMGIAYQMMFNLKDAIRCYTASLKLNPRNATVLNNLATVNDSLRQYKDAERYYRKALKIDPHSALILRNLGSNQLTQHKYKKGWEAYQAALVIDPKIFQSHSGASVENPATTQERGAMHYYMAKGCVSTGNHECAIQNLRLAINEGYISPQKIVADRSFASLYELPAFQQMIAAQGTPQ